MVLPLMPSIWRKLPSFAEPTNTSMVLWRLLGADPTAMTPQADINGVTAQGMLQTVADRCHEHGEEDDGTLREEDDGGMNPLTHLRCAVTA